MDLATAQKRPRFAPLTACAALAGVEADEIERVAKLVAMVNVARGFNDTSTVINGATDFLNKVFEGEPAQG